MSEPKLISPMLDNFDMGGAISDHDGVRCYPAMRKNSDDKYIVKIISIPASQTKLDALLLTGACQDKSAALVYFRQLANGIADEKKILDNLSRLEGFLPFEDCQVVPMDDESGYEVCLLSEYRLTLERKISRTAMTQLEAVNLGLDICAALSVCRRSGYMCIDLKPSNIYILGDKEFKIGDLGFVKLNSLKYASLPDMYRSCYTAPEVEDAVAALNETLDIYALGLILYRVYNGGELPFSGDHAPSEEFVAPAYADEEMSAIILKACNPDPALRWQDPVQMGQAIVNYMQKNGVNDTPITAKNVDECEVANETAIDDEQIDVIADPLDISDGCEGFTTKTPNEESLVNTENTDEVESAIPSEDTNEAVEDIEAEIIPIPVLENSFNSDLSNDEAEVDSALNEDADDTVPVVQETIEDEIEDVACVESDNLDDPAEEDELDNLSFLDGWVPESVDYLNTDASSDIAEMLDQIDELTAHAVPDPVVAPSPIDINVPDPVMDDDQLSSELPLQEVFGEEATATEETIEEDTAEVDMPYIPKKKRTGLTWCIILLIIAALAVGAYFFYTRYYLQPIHSLDLTGSEDKLQVSLTADIDESMLSVVCTDSHGKKLAAPVVGGVASFSGLTPDAAYTVTVEVDGLHQLTGTTTKVYSTPVQTKIVQLRAITGSEDGSAVLSFAVEGPDSEQWNVIYSAEGEAERVTAFPAHMVTLTGLTVGKEYTLRLEALDDIYLASDTQLKFVSQNLVTAENLHVISCVNGQLTAQWNAPEDTTVSEWTVRCYNENGYDETIITSDTTVTFENVDDSVENTVEVTAANMSLCQRILVSANSVTISDFTVDDSRTDIISISWAANREIPENGWNVRYAVNGIYAPTVITTNTNSVQIPIIPNGNYTFTILDDMGNSVLGGPFTYKQGETSDFAGYAVNKGYITTRLCKTPAASSWSYLDLSESDYVNTFSIGDKISVVLTLSHWYEISDDEIMTTFAIYDEAGNLVNFSHFASTWKFLWYQNYCELDLTSIPADIGTYEVFVYFNGAEVGSQKFEITA